ncbi:MAG: hypothetical protein H0T46_06030 [Deltaproteobacteria bacterium]|nr:hypothetical protein [Deltaproteobacteria bacterium]
MWPVSFVLIAIVVAAAWWLIAKLRVSRTMMAMMTTRIAFPDGGVRLNDCAGSVAKLSNPEEIVVPFEHAVLVITYPLSTPATIAIDAAFPIGFTRSELVKTVCEEYANVYEAEEATAHTKTIPPGERTIGAHRNRTDGVYGIWGYDLEKLVMRAARWTRNADGTVTIDLHIDS